MKEIFTIPAVGALLTRELSNVPCLLHSLLLHTFLCEVEGELLSATDETANIRWVPFTECRTLLRYSPERFFSLSLPALRLFLNKDSQPRTERFALF